MKKILYILALLVSGLSFAQSATDSTRTIYTQPFSESGDRIALKLSQITNDADKIPTSAIKDNAITAAKILDGSVITAKLASNAVTTDKIVDASVTVAKASQSLLDLIGSGSSGGIPIELIDSTSYANLSIDTVLDTVNPKIRLIKPLIPSGYSVIMNQNPINSGNQGDISLTLANTGFSSKYLTVYYYNISSSAGGTPITGVGNIISDPQDITGLDVTGLNDGTITTTIQLRNLSGYGLPVTDNAEKSLVVSLLSPPLASNPNPELVVGNALAFGINEANSSTVNMATPINSIVTSLLVDDGYVGDYVMQIEATSASSSRAQSSLTGISSTPNTVYQFALLYRMTQGNNGQIRFFNNATVQLYSQDNISGTDWTLITGEFTSLGSDTNIRYWIYANDSSGGAIGDKIQAKLSIKLKN